MPREDPATTSGRVRAREQETRAHRQPEGVDLSWCRGLLEKADADVLVVGHSHLPAVIHVGGAGLIVNPGALLRSSDVVSAPGTFGVLELPSRRFTVIEAASGREVAVTARCLR